MAKPGSTAKRLVVDYGELNKKTLNHSGSIPNMESTLEKIASCRYKTKKDKRSGFWQVDLMPNAQEPLAFITPQGRVVKWKVKPFGVANAPALFHELMNKILSFLQRRPKVQELISHGAQMEAHIDDVCLGTNTQEDHLILLGCNGIYPCCPTPVFIVIDFHRIFIELNFLFCRSNTLQTCSKVIPKRNVIPLICSQDNRILQ